MHDEMEDIIDEDAQQEHTTTHEAQQQGITDKLEEPQPQFTEELEEDSIGPIALQRAPLANSTSSGPHNGQLATLDEQQLQTSGVLPSEIFTGSIGTHRSPFDFSASQGQATVAMGTPEDQVTWISDAPLTETSTGSIEPHRSPLADSMLQVQANGMDSLEGQVTRFENALPVETSSGLIERHRSPLADSRLQVQANEMDTAETQATQVLDALPSETSTGLIDSHRSPLADSQLHRQHTVPVNNVPELTPPKSYLSLMLRRVNPRPQRKGSPLRELFNFANASKVLKTPRKTVNWPKNGPVTATKRFVKHEAIAYPSPASSREDNSILSSIPGDLSPRASPTGQEQDEALQSQCDIYPPLYPNTNWTVLSASTNENNGLPLVSATERTRTVNVASDERNNSPSSSSDDDHSDNSVETPVKASSNVDQTTPSSRLSPLLADLNVSTRRVSLRRREKDLEEERKRAKEEAFAAAEKARKEKEEAEGKARKKKEEAEEKARKEKAEAEEKARRDADEEAERKKVGARRIPIEKVIQPLTEEWEEKVRANMAKGMSEQLAMTSVGNPLSRRDFGKVLPQRGTGDDPSGWLNDEIISAYLQAVVDHSHAVLGHKRGDPPKVHAFNPFFYKNLAKQGGYDNVKRWGRRAKFGDVSQMEWIFVPVNTGVHWTLIAVSPIRKTIEFFDSLHHHSRNEIRIIKLWLKGELGHSFVEEEWTVVEDPAFPNKGKGPTQDNAKDCGVFTVTTAKMLSLGVDPMAVSADDMPLQRRRIVAELLNGGFSGSFEPRIAFD